MNVAHLLAGAARSFPERPAISFGERLVYSYAGLGRRAAQLAGGMARKLGLKPGDRVLLAMTNNVDYFSVLFGCWHGGFVAVPVNAKLHAAEISHIWEDCGATVCFASADIAPALGGALTEGVRLVVLGEADWERLSAGEGAPLAERSAHDPAWIFYTSGTTGKPKGAILTHRNLLAMTTGYLADVDFLTPEDCFLHIAAQSHATGLFGLSHVAKATHQILPESGGFDPAEIASLIGRHSNVTLFVPPTGLRRLVRERAFGSVPPDHLRTLLLGAAPLYAADLKAAFNVFGARLWNGYGQGESPCTIAAMSKTMLAHAISHGDEHRLSSVGIARTGIEIAIGGEDGRLARDGSPGEVLVRGDTVMAGYWNLPAATAEALRDGWLHTGDIGALDECGYLTLLDRSKDLIISGGVNIYPREVEEVLMQDPAVDEVSVIGIADPEWGECVLAVVVPRAGFEPDVARLERRCLDHIARFKRPKYWRFVERLPKNAAGKVLKRTLQERFREEFAAAAASGDTSAGGETVPRQASEITG